MIVLVDANALLAWLVDPTELREDARAAIADPLNDVLVSAATVWELEIKRALGKLAAPEDLLGAIDSEHMICLPVTGEDGVQAARLPPNHRDPFDRVLVAQACRLDAVIVTRDRAFETYDVSVIRA